MNANEAVRANFGADDSIYNGLLINGPTHNPNNTNQSQTPVNNNNTPIPTQIPSFERETNPYESNEPNPSTNRDNNNVI